MPMPGWCKFPEDPMAVFLELREGAVVYHRSGLSYKLIRIDPDGKRWAVWRHGHTGKFRKEVVQITSAHVRGFRVFQTMRDRREAQESYERRLFAPKVDHSGA